MAPLIFGNSRLDLEVPPRYGSGIPGFSPWFLVGNGGMGTLGTIIGDFCVRTTIGYGYDYRGFLFKDYYRLWRRLLGISV